MAMQTHLLPIQLRSGQQPVTDSGCRHLDGWRLLFVDDVHGVLVLSVPRPHVRAFKVCQQRAHDV